MMVFVLSTPYETLRTTHPRHDPRQRIKDLVDHLFLPCEKRIWTAGVQMAERRFVERRGRQGVSPLQEPSIPKTRKTALWRRSYTSEAIIVGPEDRMVVVSVGGADGVVSEFEPRSTPQYAESSCGRPLWIAAWRDAVVVLIAPVIGPCLTNAPPGAT
jgi:hypothetical protein